MSDPEIFPNKADAENTLLDNTASQDGVNGPKRPIEDLPPVEPPSAGFIVQLFVIPMLIVGAIVGVYALFGRLAGGEQDWRTLVTELRNTNEHRRWRAAIGLAHLLKVDADRGQDGQQLAKNTEIAKALLEVLDEEPSAGSQISDEKYLNQQQYLITALGLLDQPKTVVPALQQFLTSTEEKEQGMRIEALRSISLIANRTQERAEREDRPLLVQELVEIPSLTDDVISVTQDSEVLYRQLGAFVLGLLPSPESRQRLEVLLNDSDRDVRVNAAIGLSRQESTAGWPVFQAELKNGVEQGSEQAGMDLVVMRNSLKAVEDLQGEWSKAQKDELEDLVASLAEAHPERRIRADAKRTLQTLQGK